ncbi:MAG TPA: hypothetical protein VF493_12395, partial [Terriglobales bacterium]
SDQVKAAFAEYFRKERDRAEKALRDITDIVCSPKTDDPIDEVMARLEAHWGRYGEPGSLAPLANVLADTFTDAQGEP